FAGEEHDHAVDAECDAAVRRRAVGQCVEEEAEAFAQLLFAEAERFEEPLLDILAMNPDAAGAEFVTVKNQVVALGTDFPRRGFKFFEILLDNSGERMLSADPGFVRFAPFKE